MSRIAGIVLQEPCADGAELVRRMLQPMAALVATTDTVLTKEAAALGHRGWGPHNATATGPLAVVVDGCIYNSKELGEAPSDAELVVDLYRKYGFIPMLRKLNGDFSIALFDSTTGELWIARDRFGVKPLYYRCLGQGLAFASRPSGLLALPHADRAVDPEFVAVFAASHYRTFDNRSERSPYLGISQLPAAHVLRFANGSASVTRYWTLLDHPDHQESEDVLARQYRDLLLDAVALRHRSYLSPVFTLSGGMDSSSVLACAVRSSGEKQHAMSTVYEDPTYDESAEIQSMLDATTREWQVVKIGTPDLETTIKAMIAIHDEPVATATWLSHYLLCERANRSAFRSIFGGLGGDELNAGEFEYFFFFFADLKAAGDEAALQHETAKWIEHHDHPIFKKSFEAMRSGLSRLVDLEAPGRCLPDLVRLRRYADTLNPAYFNLGSFVPIMDTPFRSYLKNRTYQDIFRETAPCCLRASDRQATAFGLDVAWPFFDHRLVEFMFRVSGLMKIRDGVTKYLLRKAMRGVLPEATRARIKKTGWNAPAHVWFSGRGRELVLDLLASRAFRERGIYNVQRVRSIVNEHEDVVANAKPLDNHMMFLWQLVNLELWLQTNAQQEGTTSPPAPVKRAS
jgi:asparagine synthase (glutamine-hydrolysing)